MAPLRNVKKIAVVSRDTLRAVGLQNLLVSYFAPVETDLIPLDGQVCFPRGYDYYFVDYELADGGKTLPEGCRVAFLTGISTPAGKNVLDVSAGLEGILAGLERIFSAGGNEEDVRNKSLTDREIQVLRQVVSGAINKEIADRLSISFNTVLTHRKNISAKTGIKTVSGLTFYAIINGYVSPADIEF